MSGQYKYDCLECGHTFSTTSKLSDAEAEVCPGCGEMLSVDRRKPIDCPQEVNSRVVISEVSSGTGYKYKCLECGYIFSTISKLSDAKAEGCPGCGALLNAASRCLLENGTVMPAKKKRKGRRKKKHQVHELQNDAGFPEWEDENRATSELASKTPSETEAEQSSTEYFIDALTEDHHLPDTKVLHTATGKTSVSGCYSTRFSIIATILGVIQFNAAAIIAGVLILVWSRNSAAGDPENCSRDKWMHLIFAIITYVFFYRIISYVINAGHRISFSMIAGLLLAVVWWIWLVSILYSRCRNSAGRKT